jgi:hypothetical protein
MDGVRLRPTVFSQPESHRLARWIVRFAATDTTGFPQPQSHRLTRWIVRFAANGTSAHLRLNRASPVPSPQRPWYSRQTFPHPSGRLTRSPRYVTMGLLFEPEAAPSTLFYDLEPGGLMGVDSIRLGGGIPIQVRVNCPHCWSAFPPDQSIPTSLRMLLPPCTIWDSASCFWNACA